MGTVELEDQVLQRIIDFCCLKMIFLQVRHVEYLVGAGITDPKRVAIYGASYGGYMSLIALCKRPDVFRICYAYAPVTSWEAYDTAYTEVHFVFLLCFCFTRLFFFEAFHGHA
jgi:cephalosporin-C deacetylase-like acetyl esterase